MQQEYDALIQNKTWNLVPPRSDKNIIDCKWVYRIKKIPMALLTGTRQDSLQKVSSNNMVLIMKIPSAQL
jgi:hypothetical protein